MFVFFSSGLFFVAIILAFYLLSSIKILSQSTNVPSSSD